jgi:hypothetical protein
MSRNPIPFFFQMAAAGSLGALSLLFLQSGTALGLSAPTVDLGANPYVSSAGVLQGASAELFSAPAGQDILVRDVQLMMNTGSGSTSVQLVTDQGRVVGEFYCLTINGSMLGSEHSFSDGLVLYSGETLLISSTSGTLSYNVAGHHLRN